MNTELAIVQEKLSNASNELTTTKTQYDLKLTHLTAEKFTAIEKADSLEKEMMQLQRKLSEQISEHQAALKEERSRQEQSEKRWLNLIDQAKTETKNLRKSYEVTINNQSKKNEEMHTSIAVYQQKIVAQQAALDYHKTTIADLKGQLGKAHDQYMSVNSFIASLKSKQKQKIKKNNNNFSNPDVITNL